nr:hypothetical protein [uncultured bacterium]
MPTLPRLLYAESRQKVLVDVLQSTRPRPGQTLIARISHHADRIEGLRVIPTPDAHLAPSESFPDDDVRHLSQLLRAVARDLIRQPDAEQESPWWHDDEEYDPWARRSAPISPHVDGWPPVTSDLVTVVCREGDAKVTPAEILFYWAWRYSEALTGHLQAEVYAVTPHGWAGLAEGACGSYPALVRETDLAPDDGLPPGIHNPDPSSAPLPVDALPTALAGVLPEAQSQECINCYVHRMLGRFTCAGDFRIALHYRDTRAPGAKALENRLRNAGATCDCEIISAAWKRERPRRYEPEHPAGIWRVVDRAGPLTLPWPGCKQGGSRSSQPCVLWRRRKRISV